MVEIEADRATGAEPGVDALQAPVAQAAVQGLRDVALQLRDLVEERVLRQVGHSAACTAGRL